MQTKILNENQIDEAVDFLKRGDLVALPTETVYGLAANAQNEDAIKKIFLAKGRPKNHPLILHINSYENLECWVKNISNESKKLAKCFWPGPLTMVFNRKQCVSNSITGGLDTVAIRVPKHPIFLEVMNKLGGGLVAPSANAHQKTSPTRAEHVLKTLHGRISAVLDGGMSSIGLESTIVDMTKEVPTILRYGAISKNMIESALGMIIDCPLSHSERVSGNMINHYQPQKPLFLLSKSQFGFLSEEHSCAIIHYSDISKNPYFFYYKMPNKKQEYARHLYNTLHEIDKLNIDRVYVERPPNTLEWSDVMDRLVKASEK